MPLRRSRPSGPTGTSSSSAKVCSARSSASAFRQALRSRVVWTGFLDGDEPALAYNAADVLVLPSDFEPWALVIQEAMAAGLAIVASDVVGAARELIQDKSSGRIFPAGQLAGLIDAMMDVTDPMNLERYQEASQRALADWSRTTNPIDEVRRALVENGVLPAAVN